MRVTTTRGHDDCRSTSMHACPQAFQRILSPDTRGSTTVSLRGEMADGFCPVAHKCQPQPPGPVHPWAQPSCIQA